MVYVIELTKKINYRHAPLGGSPRKMCLHTMFQMLSIWRYSSVLEGLLRVLVEFFLLCMLLGLLLEGSGSGLIWRIWGQLTFSLNWYL